MTSTQKSQQDTIDATKLLMQDHQEVKERFEEYKQLVQSGAEDDMKQALAEEICDMLTVHTAIEEEIFYPAARDALDEEDLLDEATVEHASAKDLIAQIRAMEPSEALYDAKVKVLGEYIDHHVQEEENEMFPKLREADIDLEALGQSMSDRKEALESEQAEEIEEPAR